MASEDWWAALGLVVIALLTARMLSSWGDETRPPPPRSLKRAGANRKAPSRAHSR